MYLKLKQISLTPPCGWRYAVQWTDRTGKLQTKLVGGTDFGFLVRAVNILAKKHNFVPPTKDSIEDTLCRSAMSFDPEWTVMLGDTEVSAKDVFKRLPVEVWGPVGWGLLHMQGTLWLSSDNWYWSIVMISRFIHAEETGCEVCAAHFDMFRGEFPDTRVRCANEAAVWSFMAHNSSKPLEHRMPWADAAAYWGWKPLNSVDFAEIRNKLASQ